MRTHPDRGELLTMDNLAVEFKTSIHTLYKWSRRGWPHFPHAIRLPNRTILVTRAALAEWLEGRQS